MVSATSRFGRHDFLLVFRGDRSLDATVVELQAVKVSRTVILKKNDNLNKNKNTKNNNDAKCLIGNESVPIQLAQCWFPGLAVFNAKI